MAFEVLLDATEVARSVRAFSFGPTCPAGLADRLQTIPGSPADFLSVAAETLYAHFEMLDTAGLTACGQVFAYAEAQNWSVFNSDGRCGLIVQGVNYELGDETVEEPEWPAPKVEYRTDGFDWRTVVEEQPA